VHDMVAGTTLSGEPYRANDPELLNWVYATAAYGFVQAYHTYVQPLSSLERNFYYTEGVPAAVLYGATSAPRSEADLELLFEGTANRLERSDVVLEFVAIMRSGPILPLFLRPVQDLLVRAAIDLTPRWLRTILALNGYRLHEWEREVVRTLGRLRIASFWNPIQPFRPVGALACQVITCTLTKALFRPNAPLHAN
jgi:uncharacterized protein (DUF2236 family)